ncbi:MAG: sulfur carrier protein ThiS [Tepidisphaeraceae bacterium]
MTIKVNGQDQEVASGTTLTQLIQQHNLTPQKVAVELNRRLVRTEKYEETELKAGDEVEIVTFVGGG